MTVARKLAETITVAGLLAVGAAVAAAATAAADPAAPPPPADPGGPPPSDPVAAPPPGLSDILSAPVANILGQPAQTGSGAPVDLVLSQYPVPAVPGTQPAPPGMDLNTALSGNSFLLPQMFKLAAPDEGNMYSIGQGDVQDQPRLLPSLKGAHALWHGGMGRLDQSQLGQPLPGTAPPPGTNLPAGPVDFLPDDYGVPYGAPPPIGTPPAPPPGR
jgi:hypothetical protein